ncbi:PaaI family thioesterase [Salinivibrio proteolyticus]|uniref:PaaI family thioesterase n=1 Tax=Salinivibrio proteolyticus TaxID=334715 RepID=UPI001F279170|nr:PaaI family thioesterase [Salinivibrio proteolyticus]
MKYHKGMVTKEEIQAFFDTQFKGSNLRVEQIENRYALLRRPVTQRDLRPGGTVSGPFMMTLADAALYAAIFGTLGVEEMAVTTNLNMNFLQRPKANAALTAECTLLKVGKTSVVGDVVIRSKGEPAPVAHAVGTFALPKK